MPKSIILSLSTQKGVVDIKVITYELNGVVKEYLILYVAKT